MVMGDTIGMPGSESGVVKIHNIDKQALAITTDCTPRYCASNAHTGGMQAVCESYRNLCSVGALPLAITDCLNFGNPEKKEVMGQIVDAIRGISDACNKLSMPVVAGNVSLYNETEGKSIPPTPQIGAVGIINNTDNQLSNKISKNNNQDIIVIGSTIGHLQCSIYAKEIAKIEKGCPPNINLDEELQHGKFILDLASLGLIDACKDLSDGGIGIALAELCIMSKVGCEIISPKSLNVNQWLFGEDQARYIIITNKSEVIMNKAKSMNIEAKIIGKIKGNSFSLNNNKISIEKITNIRNNWFHNYFS